MEDCIFCKIIKGEIPSFKVYEDDKIFAFADINPVSKGHTLIVPKQHAKDLWEISSEYLRAVHDASKKIMDAMKKAFEPAGVACLQLNGSAVNQVVPHYHLHLIPRSGSEPELPMTTWELKEGNMDEIQQIAENMASMLE
jgi:histidine triad (HIT) family protein